MKAFGDALAAVAARVPEARAVMIMGTDGIPVERLVVKADPNLEAVAAEFTTLLRSSLSTASDSELGSLRELSVVSEGLTALIMAITPDYYLFVSLAAGGLVGRARVAMRLACLALEREFA
jgi:predicted regulator of Ras-like GTPase activity (Roadblock/LC7/MglB family)